MSEWLPSIHSPRRLYQRPLCGLLLLLLSPLVFINGPDDVLSIAEFFRRQNDLNEKLCGLNERKQTLLYKRSILVKRFDGNSTERIKNVKKQRDE